MAATKHVQTKTHESSRGDRTTANEHNKITLALGVDYTPYAAFRA